MSFMNVLKTRTKQGSGENYIRSFIACTHQIFGSLTKAGRARDTYVEKKNVTGFDWERNDTTTKAWA